MHAHRFANVHAYLQDFLQALDRASALRGLRTFIVEVRSGDLSEDEVSKLL